MKPPVKRIGKIPPEIKRGLMMVLACFKNTKLTDKSCNDVDDQGTDRPDIRDVARHHPPHSVGDP